MNYLEDGKIDGKAQFAMDKLTETTRDIVYTAIASLDTKFGGNLSKRSQAYYVGGFVEGYLVAQFTTGSEAKR